MAAVANETRYSNLFFPTAKLIQGGAENIDLELARIKMAMMSYDDLVGEQNSDKFRFFAD